MTALAGVWRHDGQPDAGMALHAMLAAQALYGPDGLAAWQDGPIAIGRALSSLLPEDRFDTGPVIAGGGRFALAADVRLDNRAELAAALGIDTAELAVMSDAALLMAAWLRWEAACLDHILGDYAFALWDGARRRLHLVRDPTGQRPLFFHSAPGFTAFASMPAGLHALPAIPRAVDGQRFAEFLCTAPGDGERSFHAGVARVAPGEYVTLDDGGDVARTRWWRPDCTPCRRADSDEYVAAARAELDAAVTRRLRGAGPVAAQLSAGLDSSGVAATAARLHGGPLLALTAVPRQGYPAQVGGRLADEGPLAATIAAAFPNMEHRLVRAGPLDLLDDIALQTELGGRPVLNGCNAGWLNASFAAAQARGCRVLLTGLMGNLSLSYSGRELLPELFAQWRFVSWWRAARATAAQPERRWPGVLAQTARPLFPPAWTRPIDRRRRGETGPAPAMLNPHARLSLPRTPESWRTAAAARLFGLGRMDVGMSNKLALGGWGIDQRDPTADRRLIEFCLRVPTEEYCQEGEERRLARRVLADRLPPAILAARWRGYQGADWHERLAAVRAPARALIADLQGMPVARELLDLERMRALLDDLPDDGWNDWGQVARYRQGLLRGLGAGIFLRATTGA